MTGSDQTSLRVDIGCGDHKPAGFIGVDVVPGPGVDIVADIAKRFPFETGTVAYLRAHDIVEHLHDRIHTMNEIWRVCRDDAIVDIRVPSTDGRGAFQDPTHVSYWNANSFFYYSNQHPAYLQLSRKYGFRGGFRIQRMTEETSPDKVVHVHVILQAVKTPAAALQPPSPAAEPRRPPFTPDTLAAGASLRLILAASIVAAPDNLDQLFTPAIGKVYTDFTATQPLPRTFTDDERRYAEWLSDEIGDGIATPHHLACQLALFLFRPPHRTPAVFGTGLLPPALAELYVRAIARPMVLALRQDDIPRYAEFHHAFLRHLDDGLAGSTGGDVWVAVGSAFINYGDQLGLLFTGDNLCAPARLRAGVIERTVRLQGSTLDHDFGPRQPGPYRVGIFIRNLQPTPELFAVLPILQRRHRAFHFTVFCTEDHSVTFPTAEITRVARIVQLPGTLAQILSTVRAQDLDVAFIGANMAFAPGNTAVLAAHRIARVQVASIATMCTTGFRNVDAYLSSAGLERDPFPQRQYTEELIKLPATAHCFAYGKGRLPGDSYDAHPGIPVAEGETVFTSSASMFKLVPEVIDTWVDLLEQVPTARLVLFPFNPTWTGNYPKEHFSDCLAAKLMDRGLDPKRVRLLDPRNCNRVGIRRFMSSFHVCLDTFPCSGSTSLIEPLECGLPVVTLAGSTMRSAMAASMLRAIGLDELVTTDRTGYLDLAIRLARDPAYRARLSSRIRDAMAGTPPFRNSDAYTTDLLDVFRRLLAERLQEADPIG